MAELFWNLMIILFFAIFNPEKPAEETSSPRKRWLKTDTVLYIPSTTNIDLNEEQINLFQTLAQVSEIANKVMGLFDTIFAAPSQDAIALEEKLKSTKLLQCWNEVSATQVSEILKIFLVFWNKFLTDQTGLKKRNEFSYDKLLNQVSTIHELKMENQKLVRRIEKIENQKLKREKELWNQKLSSMSKCQCTSPAKYSPEGFGNCHYKASKAGQRAWLWCYVERKFGDPRNFCPDAIASVSSP